MGSVHEEVGLSWQGEEYTVPPDEVMGLVEVIEDIITIEELAGKGIKRVKLARAFAAALRYAGARKVTDKDVYQTLFDGEAIATTEQIVHALLALMIPPEHLRTTEKPATPGKKKPPPRKAGSAA